MGLPARQTADIPSLAAHARAHGISPDYILPRPSEAHGDGRHGDDHIQTLLFAERLDRVGRSLHDRGHAFERETGVNVLHAAFGVLEWNEPGSSRSPTRSPLLLQEVRMERRKTPAGTEYRVCGENGTALNTTLAQTLGAQFGLELPPYEGGSVEDYFASVAALAPSGWHWSLRREALVGIFPSSRIAMYRDLDPDAGAIAGSPLVERMLSSVGGDPAQYAEVYDTDAPEVETRVPRLVMDADASQFSSLVDVANGDNVAIEGPPGSGKSQTIVNLVASAMADGKKVLFVAEKLTALDVVRNRLDAAGLGEFVLPLQAGRGSRDAVFQSLDDRLSIECPGTGSGTGSGKGAVEAHRAKHDTLKRHRGEMRSYLDMLGTRLGKTGLTVHEALGRAIASAQHLEGLPRNIRRLRLPAPEMIDPETQTAIDGDARMVVDRLNGADGIAALWRDAGKAPLRADEAEDIAGDLGELAGDIETLCSDAGASPLCRFLPDDPFDADGAAIPEALSAIAGDSGSDPDLVEALLDPGLRQAAREVCETRETARGARDTLEGLLADPDAADTDETIRAAGELVDRHHGVLDPASLAGEIASLEDRRDARLSQRELALALPARWAERAQQDGTTLADLRLDAEMLLSAPVPVLEHRQADEARATPDAAREAAATQRQLAAELGKVRETLPRAGRHEARALNDAAGAIENGGLFRAFSGAYRGAWSLYREGLGGASGPGRAAAAAALRKQARWAGKRDAFAGDARLARVLGAAFSGLRSDPDFLEALAAFHDTAARICRGDERLRYALEAGPLDPLRAFAADGDMPATTLEALGREIDGIDESLARLRDDREAAAALCLSFGRCDRIDADLVDRARAARAALVVARQQEAQSRAGGLLSGLDDADAVLIAVRLADRVASLPDPGRGIALLRAGDAAPVVEAARRFFGDLRSVAGKAATIAGEIALSGYDAQSETGALRALAARSKDIPDAVARPEGLVERARLLRAVAALETRGLGGLTGWVQSEPGRAHRDALPDIVAAIFARSLTDCVEAEFGRTLDAQDGADLDRLRRKIAKLDRKLTGLSRKAIREELTQRSDPPRGNGTGKVATFSEMSLIRHELGKARNRIGVRDLTRRAGAALIDLKPCWMMSPLAVAQYLRDDFVFDLVVIDEASQMTPENALGAIMRARQVVVVGDTKQLPPTKFFSKVLTDPDEDEDTRTDSESILDMANTTFTPVRQLRWHYRSRHPDLIAISNRMIYDSQLTIFPAAGDADPDLGVDLVEVAGTYGKGRNLEEARAIVAGAIRHMRDHPGRSLGLATMNREQTELIVSEFERERARHPHVEAFIEYWSEKEDGLEEFFVKNLETIQGDERDVILISTLYGPDADTGKVYQRFGPVNSAHGHRRLNVLFSRAREKIITYSSLKPADILVDGKAYGVAVLRGWLEFSRTGRVADSQPGRAEPESAFEEFVISQVEAAGYEAVPQVGASGYRIDIGIRHPEWPYGFILAVECDGASYHSSRSSRDRDRLRQQILEGLGWHFHRIWSTDWFRDPRRQIERLRAALDGALERVRTEEASRRQERARAAERACQGVEETDETEEIEETEDTEDTENTEETEEIEEAEEAAERAAATGPEAQVRARREAGAVAGDGASDASGAVRGIPPDGAVPAVKDGRFLPGQAAGPAGS